MGDLSKLAFSSAFRYERVVLKSNVPFSVTPAAFSQTLTVVHDLGYKPYVKAWYSYGSGKTYALFAGPSSFDIDGNGGQINNVYVTNTSFVVVIDNYGPGTISGSVYYRIYAEAQA